MVRLSCYFLARRKPGAQGPSPKPEYGTNGWPRAANCSQPFDPTSLAAILLRPLHALRVLLHALLHALLQDLLRALLHSLLRALLHALQVLLHALLQGLRQHVLLQALLRHVLLHALWRHVLLHALRRALARVDETRVLPGLRQAVLLGLELASKGVDEGDDGSSSDAKSHE